LLSFRSRNSKSIDRSERYHRSATVLTDSWSSSLSLAKSRSGNKSLGLTGEDPASRTSFFRASRQRVQVVTSPAPSPFKLKRLRMDMPSGGAPMRLCRAVADRLPCLLTTRCSASSLVIPRPKTGSKPDRSKVRRSNEPAGVPSRRVCSMGRTRIW
jgi:hypothetical protein